LIGGVWAGLLSREISITIGVPTSSNQAEGHVAGGVIASRRWTLRGRRTLARTTSSMRENREIPRSPVLAVDAPSLMVRGVACRPVAGRKGNAEAVSP
jgi:hypothetical protein